jgi:RNA polymerase sigma factor (sigma-70 family)
MVNNINCRVLSDQEVIEGIAKGSTSELEYLYASYFPMIFQLVTKNNGDEDDAKDIFQEAVIVLYDRINSGDFVLTSKLKTFLYSVCKRLWLKRLNKNDRMVFNVQEHEEVIAVENDLLEYQLKEEQFLLMEQSLHLLGEPCQTIISDFYLRNLSMQEICEKFGYTNADNAKTQKYKCLQRLKKLFFG